MASYLEHHPNFAENLKRLASLENCTNIISIEEDLSIQRSGLSFLRTLEDQMTVNVLVSKFIPKLENGEPKDDEYCREKKMVDCNGEGNVQGSPLQMMKVANLSISSAEEEESDSLQPLPIFKARMLLSEVYQISHDSLDMPAVWIFCDKRNPANIILLGTQPEHGKAWKQHKVTCAGPVVKKEIPLLKILLKENSLHIGQVNCVCTCEYNILDGYTMDTSQAGSQAQLKLHLQWSKTKNFLEPPTMDSKTIAKVIANIVAGDMRSAAYRVYEELYLLQLLYQGLSEGTIRWLRRPGQDEESPSDRVQKLITDVGQGFMAQLQEKLVANTETNNLLKNFVLDNRHDLDFVDQLWIILKDCTSYEELTTCWQLVYSELKGGQLQPVIHRRKKSQVADHIRASYDNKMTAPSLSGTLPLQLLIEIGIEKLQRDYLSNLVGNELVTATQLDYYVLEGLSLEAKVERLGKLHNVLELVVMLEQYLNLPHKGISIAARTAIQYYQKAPLQDEVLFNIPVEPMSVMHVLQRFEPAFWTATFDKPSTGIRLAFHLSVEWPLDQLSKPEKTLNDLQSAKDVDEEVQVPYYLLSHFSDICRVY